MPLKMETDISGDVTFVGHIFSDAVGNFPAKLKEWEAKVVNTEIARRSCKVSVLYQSKHSMPYK